MWTVLTTSNNALLSRLTPYFSAALLALFITFEAPLSGMSMNPARSFGSAAVANVWTSLWIYFAAPPFAMLLAAEFYLRAKGAKEVYCAKLYHYGRTSCIFNCRFGELGKKEDFIEVTKQKQLFPTITQLF
jgi:aquaporin Z